MEEAHQPLSSPSYMEPVPASASQPTAVFPMNQEHQPNQQTPPSPHPLNSQSNERPSMICGFTLTELAHVTIQVAGIIIAAVFGAWAVKSYESSEGSLSKSDTANQLARDALRQSSYANILAIINLCLSESFRDSVVECSAMIQGAPFASVIHSVIPSLPTLTPSLTTTLPPMPTTNTASPTTITTTVSASSGSLHISFGAIVGIIVTVVVGVAIFCLLLVRFRRAKRSRF